MGLDVVILAAGEGTRMRSRLPKVLHPLAGKPLLGHVIDAARALEPSCIHVVHGHHGERVRAHFHDAGVEWVEQAERLGTGHAVQQVMPAIASESTVLVLYGDVPLIRPDTLRDLLEAVARHGLAIVTATLDDPAGYGRIVRDAQGNIMRIVEEKDASDAERDIEEINTGILAAHAALLSRCLERLDNRNAQGEFYLTDVIALAVAEGITPGSTAPEDNDEILGVNTRAQLAELEGAWQSREAERLMRDGVTLRDPARIDVRGTLVTGTDVTIDINCVFEGEVEIADDVSIGPGCVIRNARIGKGTYIDAHSIIDGAVIGAGCCIGPFARVRPETMIADQVHVGNFVEIKKAEVGRGSKMNHLSYIGDATIGSGVNIGAGTITCNYDGANKHRTVIGDGAFIGSDTQLVAPVTVGAGATIGAGSTITRDAPPGELTLSRTPQRTRPGWTRPAKKGKGS